jgi:hypothetical protein
MKNLEKNIREFCLCLFIPIDFSTCRKILQHGANGFTSLRKKVVLQIFIAIKKPSSLAGFDPRTLGPVANTITRRPRRATVADSRLAGQEILRHYKTGMLIRTYPSLHDREHIPNPVSPVHTFITSFSNFNIIILVAYWSAKLALPLTVSC